MVDTTKSSSNVLQCRQSIWLMDNIGSFPLTTAWSDFLFLSYSLILLCITPFASPTLLLHPISWLARYHHGRLPGRYKMDVQSSHLLFPPINPPFISILFFHSWLIPSTAMFSSFTFSSHTGTDLVGSPFNEDWAALSLLWADSSLTAGVGQKMCHILTIKCSSHVKRLSRVNWQKSRPDTDIFLPGSL